MKLQSMASRAGRLLWMLALAAFAGFTPPSPVTAQWSIGAKGQRAAPAGKRRFVFLVFANPRPGQEEAFNDWYDYEHLGDLVQLPGWTGGQRFRLVTTISPRPTADGYRQGYLVLWDQEATDPHSPRAALDAAQDGGKARKSDTFDYVAGASPKAEYEAIGARIGRRDGIAPSIPAAGDNHSHRLSRFVVLDFSDPPAGTTPAAHEAALDRRIAASLTVPGWMGAQRFRAVPTPGSRGGKDDPSPFPRDLVIWEVQADSAQAAQASLAAAQQAGSVARSSSAPGAIFTYWRPLGPYIDRDSFAR